MSAESNRRTVFAVTCRSRASLSISPFRRDHLRALAQLSDFEAELASILRIAED
jgi:hypothetical protein